MGSDPKMPSGIKTCYRCGEDLPATIQYFDQDMSKPDGMRTTCKQCRMEAKDETRKSQRDNRLKMMDDAAFKLLENVARGGSDVPHIAETYQRLMDVFDGAGGFAAHFMAQYLEATPGSTTRTKMLELVMRIGFKVSESGAAQIPLELMSDQDLQNKLDQQARRMFRIEDGSGRSDDDHGTAEKAS